MTVVYGVVNSEGCLIDTSLTLLGAKQYATRHGYKTIGVRAEYNVFATWEKVGSKWIKSI